MSRVIIISNPPTGPRWSGTWSGPEPGWRLSWQRGCRAHRPPVLAGVNYVPGRPARCSGNAGPLLPTPGLLPTSLRCPSPTAVGEASNATSCENPAHRSPPTHCLGLPKEMLGCAQLAVSLPQPRQLALDSLDRILTQRRPHSPLPPPPFSSRPVPSADWPVRNFCLGTELSKPLARSP